MLSKKRKEYTKVKKNIKQALTKHKQDEYQKMNETIKKLPIKQRQKARASLRTELAKKNENACVTYTYR